MWFRVLFSLLLFVGTKAAGSSQLDSNLRNELRNYIDARKFGLFLENEICDEKPFLVGRLMTLDECRKLCVSVMHKCKYFAHWKERHKEFPKITCEVYETCNTYSADPEAPSVTYKLLNECEVEIVYGVAGYLETITEAFPYPIVRFIHLYSSRSIKLW